VTVRLTHWRGPVRRAALVALVSALPSLPLAAASDPSPAPAKTSAAAKPSTIQAAVRAAAVREAAVVKAPRANAVKRAEQSSTSKSSGFFRSGPGAVALAVMAAGTGYAIYSASHDRIKSPAKN